MPDPRRPRSGKATQAPPPADEGEDDDSEDKVPPKPEKNVDIVDALRGER